MVTVAPGTLNFTVVLVFYALEARIKQTRETTSK